MTAVVIIVSARRDMLSLCRAALRVHAPDLPVCIVATSGDVRDWMQGSNDQLLALPGARSSAESHASGIELARGAGVGRDSEIVILLDDDTVILSDRWWPTIETAFATQTNLGMFGGVRSRGLIGQSYIDGLLIPHAHMLALRGEVFRRVTTFHAENDGTLPYVRYDTGTLACLQMAKLGYAIRTLGFYEPGMGPLYWERSTESGIPATEYFDSGDPGHILWAHLGRGTSFAPRGWAREHLRRLAARLGSPRAAKILRRQDDRQRFIARSWELLMGPWPW